MKDMFAAYVALSRVKRADNVLLLRAFSPDLFRHGPPAGPHCLMKLLRARLVLDAGVRYTPEEARQEFEQLLKERHAQNQ